MNLWRLILREIAHRRLNFLLGLCSVAAAAASVVAADVLLTENRMATARILAERQQAVSDAVAERQAAVDRAGAELQDMMRKTMLQLGFNILIVPEDQDLSELHLNGTLSRTMPEDYVSKLASSSIITVNHLLPSVTKRVRWEEKNMDIILFGTRGEVPIMHASQKKPLLDAVPPGTLVAGYQVHTQLGLKTGDKVSLLGQEFTVTKLHPERGSADDVTVWIDLAQAQEMLGMQNLIHAILALECECAGDRISQIRAEIGRILPGTQIVERYSQALTRAEARTKAKQVAEKALEEEQASGAASLQQERDSRLTLEQQYAEFAGVLVPLAIVAAAIWVSLLALGNARQRTAEIGILRAIGLRTHQVQMVLLARAALMGLLGAALGILPGLAAGAVLSDSPASVPVSWLPESLNTVVLLSVLTAGPALSVAASWLPAMLAARRDPALILQAD